MGKSKHLSKDLREKEVQLHKSGSGYKKIAKQLIMPVSTVQTIIKKWKTRGTTDIKPRSGRPSKISPTTARKMVRDVKKTSANITGNSAVPQRKPCGGVKLYSEKSHREIWPSWKGCKKESTSTQMPQRHASQICQTQQR